MTQAIGGYLGLELGLGSEYHTDAIQLNSGRNCLEYILRVRHYKKVYIPYFTCNVVLEPFRKLGVEYSFYHIDANFRPTDLPQLSHDEAFLYTNYYGLKSDVMDELARYYGSQFIGDNAMAFFHKPTQGDYFCSPRKFMGVADGGYLMLDSNHSYTPCCDIQHDESWHRMIHLLKRIDVSAEFGFQDFHDNEDALCNTEMRLMSNITRGILASIDYQEHIRVRRDNFSFLHNRLQDVNELNVNLPDDAVPLAYPLLISDTSLRQLLIENRIYPARFWPNVLEWCESDSVEYRYANNIIALPIDQRYGRGDMDRIISLIKQ